MSAPEIIVEKWSPCRKDSLRGYLTILLPSDVRLHDIAIFRRDSRCWAIPPGRTRIGRDGLVMRDPDSGKAVYMKAISFGSLEAEGRFTDAIIAALLRVHPDALSGGS